MLHFKWVFTLTDRAGGGTISQDHRFVKKTLDKRPGQHTPVLVYEVLDGKIWRKLWPEDIQRVEQETV